MTRAVAARAWWAGLMVVSAACGASPTADPPPGAGAPDGGARDASASPPPAAQDADVDPEVDALPSAPLAHTISLDPRGFYLDGVPRLLRGGSLQWFRLPEAEWEDRLQRFKAAGFNAIDLYVAWNLHEPEEGKFNFNSPNLPKFLELAKRYGLYVYLRPGPYFTNEWDGGGVPAWVLNKTTKKSLGADGKLNLRTVDPDYLAAVRKYYEALNAVVKPYLVTHGGPVLLYAIENEYDWFELFFKVDKLFWYEGGEERSLTQPLDTTAYLGALRDMVRAGGIDIPITTCPGKAKIAGMGEVSGVVPMPNDYERSGTEAKVTELLASMHDPAQNGGRFVGFPSGFTESDRSAGKMKRALLAGMDAYFAFNVAGMHQEGAHNAMILDQSNTLSFSIDSIRNAFVSPTVGFLPGVIDFNGPIGAMGSLRTKFYNFRRANLFFDAFEAPIAGAGSAQRSGKGFAGGDPRVVIDHAALGSDESGTRVHTWIDAGGGERFVGLLNASGKTQTLPRGALTIDGVKLPKYTDITIPPEPFDGEVDTSSTAPLGAGTDLDSEPVLVVGHRIAPGLRLAYTTSETLTLRDFNGRKLLVLHGPEGAAGELALDQLTGAAALTFVSDGVVVDAHDDAQLAVHYTYGAPRFLRVTTREGALLDVVVTTTELAGKFWFLRAAGEDIAVAGPDYVAWARASGRRVRLGYEHRADALSVLTLSRAPFAFDGFTTSAAFDPVTGASTFAKALAGGSAPTAPVPLPDAARIADSAEAAPSDPFVGSTGWSGEPRTIEALGVSAPHVWYRAELDLAAAPDAGRAQVLRIDHASDFVSVYVNGHYVTTRTPLGTEIDGVDVARYLVAGRNVLAFRVGVWGHGSFMWPRGTLIPSKAAAPSIGFDSVKGLWGAARVGDTQLTQWSARAGLGGERLGFAEPTFDDAAWTRASGAPAVGPGAVTWYRWKVRSTALPDPEKLFAPMGIALRGKNAFATVYVNGHMVGRWISDEGWLGRGFWGRVKRNMWSQVDPDQIPIAREILAPGDGENVLSIALEDMSDGAGGQLDAPTLAPIAEGLFLRGAAVERSTLNAHRGVAVMR